MLVSKRYNDSTTAFGFVVHSEKQLSSQDLWNYNIEKLSHQRHTPGK